jgi:hypothetical protein
MKVPRVASGGVEQQDTGECGSSARHMHDARAGEVGEAEIVAKAEQTKDGLATPGPTAVHRVDETGHDHCEQQEGPQLHAFGHGTRDNRHGGCHEHYLEEEVRGVGIHRTTIESGFRRFL